MRLEWLDEQEFDNLMQCYRHTPIHMQDEVVKAFEDVKKYIKLMFIRDLLDMRSTKEIQEMIHE